MPVAGGRGGGTNQIGKPKKDRDPIVKTPTASTTLQPSSSVATSSPSRPGSAAGTRGGGVLGASRGGRPSTSSSSSSASSSTNAYLAAQRKSQAAAKNRYLEDASRLNGQIAALAEALGPKGEFKDALEKRLKGIDETLKEQTTELLGGFTERWSSLDADQLNNEIAAGDSSNENDTNRVRERRAALSEAAMQGAGESDQLLSQVMSLRNFEANQGEINRSYSDSARSIVASRIDLRADTRNALQNMAVEADADRQQLWDDYWQQSSETQVALGNALGQQAEYYGLAKEQGAKSVARADLAPGLGSGRGKGKGRGKGRVSGFGMDEGAGGFEAENEPDTSYQSGGKGRGMLEFRTTTSTGGQGQATRGGKKKPGQNGTKSQGGKGNLGIDKAMDRAERESDEAFMKSSELMGRAYDPKGVPEWLKSWGPEITEPKQLGSSLLQNARTTIAQKRPEGATLRKW